jgi:hypothetical protein
MLIHTDTAIRGEPVAAGTVVEVDEETAYRLTIRGTVLPPEAAPVPFPTRPEVIENDDPAGENRDPEPKRSHHKGK